MSVKILAIESSCDETSASVVEDGRKVLSLVISSQIDIHKLYGGVVPEIASRKHIEIVSKVVDEALLEANTKISDLSAIAVTAGPGLVGALLVGVSYAKALAYAAKLPLVPVHHIEGHISANFIADETLKPPFLCLVASGGHSHIVKVCDYSDFKIMGQTRDDAAGEAFDKAARVLGLKYPGGPLIDAMAKLGDKNRIGFPKVTFPDNSLDFSFSGVKTALLFLVHKLSEKGYDVTTYKPQEVILNVENDKDFSGGGVFVPAGPLTPADIAASFQRAVVDVLIERCVLCAKKEGLSTLAVSGGVAANSYLRETLVNMCENEGIRALYPKPVLCTDNAAMIGCAAYYGFLKGNFADETLNATPYIPLGKSLF